MLAAVDIVADPSAPNAFVEGVMEGKEWVWNNGVLEPRQIESYKDRIQKASTIRESNEGSCMPSLISVKTYLIIDKKNKERYK